MDPVIDIDQYNRDAINERYNRCVNDDSIIRRINKSVLAEILNSFCGKIKIDRSNGSSGRSGDDLADIRFCKPFEDSVNALVEELINSACATDAIIVTEVVDLFDGDNFILTAGVYEPSLQNRATVFSAPLEEILEIPNNSYEIELEGTACEKPVITDIRMPATMLNTPGSTIDGTIHFKDANGDVTHHCSNVISGSTNPRSRCIPLENLGIDLNGVTEGTIPIGWFCPDNAGSEARCEIIGWIVEATLMDAAGNVSQPLRYTFDTVGGAGKKSGDMVLSEIK